jgi:hypothetical protein
MPDESKSANKFSIGVCIMFTHKVVFYVPSTKNVGEKLNKSERRALVTRVESTLARAFGGSTSTQGIGAWITNDGRLVRENVTLVTSYHGLETDEALAIVVPLAEAIKTEYGQEAIAIETEAGIDFI